MNSLVRVISVTRDILVTRAPTLTLSAPLRRWGRRLLWCTSQSRSFHCICPVFLSEFPMLQTHEHGGSNEADRVSDQRLAVWLVQRLVTYRWSAGYRTPYAIWTCSDTRSTTALVDFSDTRQPCAAFHGSKGKLESTAQHIRCSICKRLAACSRGTAFGLLISVPRRSRLYSVAR